MPFHGEQNLRKSRCGFRTHPVTLKLTGHLNPAYRLRAGLQWTHVGSLVPHRYLDHGGRVALGAARSRLHGHPLEIGGPDVDRAMVIGYI